MLRLLESLVEILESLVERSLTVPDYLVERLKQISDGGVVGALGQSFVGEPFVNQVGDQGGGCVGAFHDLPIVVKQQTGVAGLGSFFLVVPNGLRYVLVHFVLMWGGDETRGICVVSDTDGKDGLKDAKLRQTKHITSKRTVLSMPIKTRARCRRLKMLIDPCDMNTLQAVGGVKKKSGEQI